MTSRDPLQPPFFCNSLIIFFWACYMPTRGIQGYIVRLFKQSVLHLPSFLIFLFSMLPCTLPFHTSEMNSSNLLVLMLIKLGLLTPSYPNSFL